MATDRKRQGGGLFIMDNSDETWKVQRCFHDWCQPSESIDIAPATSGSGRWVA